MQTNCCVAPSQILVLCHSPKNSLAYVDVSKTDDCIFGLTKIGTVLAVIQLIGPFVFSQFCDHAIVGVKTHIISSIATALAKRYTIAFAQDDPCVQNPYRPIKRGFTLTNRCGQVGTARFSTNSGPMHFVLAV